MNFKQIVKDYFTFSRSERKGITILLIIIFILAVANKVIFYFETPAKIDTSLLDTTRYSPNRYSDTFEYLPGVRKLFKFNPNSIGRQALDCLSVPEVVKRNLLKFREKGGKIYSKEDFRKIYGLTDSIYSELEPFLVFGSKPGGTIRKAVSPSLFAFDPNTATDSDFGRLGLTGKQIKTIRKYQDKGGKFKNKDDFLKMYGITDSLKNIISDYIQIPENEAIQSGKKLEAAKIEIEINGADSVELEELPGIGEKLSKRIIKYRDLLGGFYSASQLKEVYGLSEQVFRQVEQRVKVDPAKIHKVDLNFADWNELAKHPYIQKKLARQIVKFRSKYGSIHDPSVLRDSMILNTDEYSRIRPYL